MAITLLNSYNVSDLCIGKPALRSLSPTATVAEALSVLKRGGGAVALWGPPETNPTIVGRLCMVDVLCYLCAEENLASPSSALSAPISALLSEGSDGLVRRVEPKTSVLAALDILLEGAQYLVVPICKRSTPLGRKKNSFTFDFCWLTPEDFVRFFLNNIAFLSPTPTLPISSLGIIRPAEYTIHHSTPAILAMPLLHAAVATQSSVAVLSDDGRLVGEISPYTLSLSDESAAAAIATLPAGDLISFLDCQTSHPTSTMRAIKSQLKSQNLLGMLELLEPDIPSSNSSIVSASSSGSESSGCESSDEEPTIRRIRRNGSYTARMGRKREDAIVCHEWSSLVAVMVQALAHRVGYIWVVDEEYGLVGIVEFLDILNVFREQFREVLEVPI
ncbi:CBS domain-containing protein CBSX5-like protein [Carex littledalei]|uniref:CBS domain-containing protein CBSX5-like protein n=1 Tax=Carex littledalei TaxID=544730 RepID=A0A833VDX2_9POAL|nr:CBS domain-containing protein CBSX5-like protein [Carex littledalei]